MTKTEQQIYKELYQNFDNYIIIKDEERKTGNYNNYAKYHGLCYSLSIIIKKLNICTDLESITSKPKFLIKKYCPSFYNKRISTMYGYWWTISSKEGYTKRKEFVKNLLK